MKALLLDLWYDGINSEMVRPLLMRFGRAHVGWFSLRLARHGETRFAMPSWERCPRLWSFSVRCGLVLEVVGPFGLRKVMGR